MNIPEFWICQGYAGFRICLNNSWIWLNMPDYSWKYLNILEYDGKCMNVPKSVWMAFLLHFAHFTICFAIPFSTWTRGYLFEPIQETRDDSLKEDKAVFLKRKNLIFSIATGSISFDFCFRLNIFSSKFWICCYLSGPRSGRFWVVGCES